MAAVHDRNEGSAAALATTRTLQARATSPDASAWVSANAGTGKTFVLARRVLRLLLAGVAPGSILCLTFTKAAAAEMAARVNAALGRWATCAPADLADALGELLERPASEAETLLARRLFTTVLEAPGGLKIQTIHAFCEKILRQFPLEAGVAPGFTILGEDDAASRLREATSQVLDEAAAGAQRDLAQALDQVILHAGEDRFDEVLRAVLARRETVRAMIRHEQNTGQSARDQIAHLLGIDPQADLPSTITAQAGVLGDSKLKALIAALSQSTSSSDLAIAAALDAARQTRSDDAETQARALSPAFLTKDGKPRADRGYPTKAVTKAAPDAETILRDARDRFAALETRRIALMVAAASGAVVSMADRIFGAYDARNRIDGVLSYDDLIVRTLNLLEHGAAWVLYRLDGGLSHLLVDEAQDTSPVQWRIIELLSAEFFAGQGAHDHQRTMFGVGDPKQSIYGFQGAAPELFAALGDQFRQRAQAAALGWHDVPLSLSFRTVPAVLKAVDLVFADAGEMGAAIAGGPVRHDAFRAGHAGCVEVWPLQRPEDGDGAAAWAPLDEDHAAPGAAESLARHIATRISGWIGNGEVLQSQGRAVRPGDILILVRKRAPFAALMIRALKERGIPVAGADRMRLTDQLAVLDLLALGDVLLLPEDDLSLACVLKSPIFGLSEEALFALAHNRQASLWQALIAAGHDDPTLRGVGHQLENWRQAARRQRPFEFFLDRLHGDGLRAAFVRRLGPEADDAIGEFLDLALHHESLGPASMQGFVHWLRRSGAEVRRDMEQSHDQVRVMTVHGAKGLEANIVILPDTCSGPGQDRSPVILCEDERMPPGWRKRLIWPVAGGTELERIQTERDIAKQAARAEHWRLLYVAMTRARDRLYVTGFENRTKRGRATDCWYDMIREALEPEAERTAGEDGREILRLASAQTASVSGEPPPSPPTSPAPVPEWLNAPAPAERSARTTAPSRAGDDTLSPEPDEADSISARHARWRGELIHLLLESLPEVADADRDEAARRILAQAAHGGPRLAPGELDIIAAAALSVLRAPALSWIFAQGSRAEVPVAATIGDDVHGAGILGRIDRLILRDDEVIAVDYKTGSVVPASPEEVPETYAAQMDAYARALAATFPGSRVRTFLLWTQGPELMEITRS